MNNSEIIKKYKEFLKALKAKIKTNETFSLSRLINDSSMSDSAREALYSSNIIIKTGTGRGAKYCWLAEEITDDLVALFRSKIKIVNKTYNRARNTKNLGLMRNKLFTLLSLHYSSFSFTDNGLQFIFEFSANELSSEFCKKLKEFEDFSIQFSCNKIILIFTK
ncbi:hypothetical protein [Chryseobacterium mulctrae]|uniref:hypothetical protein n=1 Tax=Chryseobacterium mulctrae TaxID=2576777 RepID=UPI001115C0A3|nr:hypothetical protein [Chryseobacterium mulctrae]